LGDEVSRGDTLAVLDSVALGKEKAAYLTAAARYRTRQAAYARDRKLAADQIVSESDLAETRAADQQAQAERRAERAELRLYGLDDDAIDAIEHSGDEPLSRLELVAPRDGVIAKRDLVAGQTLDANETPIHVVDNSRMWLMIDAAEQALPRLAGGQTVRFSVRPLPSERFTGEIDWISPQLDSEARTVRIRAIVDNPRGLLRAGMFATATIATDNADQPAQRALVPVDAVQQVGEREGVFVPGDEANAFRFTAVQTGAESAGEVEIVSGLAPGDRLVVRGAFDLKAALTAGARSAAHSH
jgi:cobalt-zinc-cadmium efflux system membrane fusion protein